MARPIKQRRVEFIPDVRYFIPVGVPRCKLEENVLKIEELEALRLKDIEGLDHEACAYRMNLSRQTFYKILLQARAKLADSLVNGKAIRIEGGNYVPHRCPIRCTECQREWEELMETLKKATLNGYACPYCGSEKITCTKKRGGKTCCSIKLNT